MKCYMCKGAGVLVMVAFYTALLQNITAQTSLRVFTEPGVEVFLDEKYMGVSELKFGGFQLSQVEAGEYELSMYKYGNYPQKVRIAIQKNKTNYVYTAPFTDGKESAFLRSEITAQTVVLKEVRLSKRAKNSKIENVVQEHY